MTTRMLVLACLLICGPASGQDFVRGDVSSDATTSIPDVLLILYAGFGVGPLPGCLEAMDVDNNGMLEPLVDVLYLLHHMFHGGPVPPMPYPFCGPIDATDAVFLGCEEPPEACL